MKIYGTKTEKNKTRKRKLLKHGSFCDYYPETSVFFNIKNLSKNIKKK